MTATEAALGVTDRPIIFSAPMVRALLAGTKTQTRRLIKPKRKNSLFDGSWTDDYVLNPGNAAWRQDDVRYAAGDRLWVRETYFQLGHWEPVEGALTRKGKRQKWRFVPAGSAVLFDAPAGYRKGRHAADPGTIAWHQRLGRFMPRKLSRTTLTVRDVRVQRLQEISEEDALAEGCIPEDASLNPNRLGPARRIFEHLWDALHGEGAWAANPWIVALTFTVERAGGSDAPQP